MTRMNMVRLGATGFLLMLYLSKAVSQTTPAAAGNFSTTSTTTTTCSTGSDVCSTEQTSVGSELPVNQEITTSPLPSTTKKATSTTSTLENVRTSETAPSTTTKKGPSTTTTPPPPTSSPETNKLPEKQVTGYTNSGTCACDLLAFSCDINCCCDPDCSPHNRRSFSHCDTSGYPSFDNRYCHIAQLVFLNNSQYVLQQAQNGAFCIVRSNLAGSVLYPVHPIFVTQQEFKKHWERSHSPVWPESAPPQLLSIDKSRSYVAGSTMWVLYSNQVHTLDLPSSGLTSACTAKKSVQYLEPWSSQCIRKTPTNLEECYSVSSDLYNEFSAVVRSPMLVNHTELLSGKFGTCPEKICSRVKFFLCSNSVVQDTYLNSCKNISNPKSLFGFKSGTCYGVIRSLKLIFFHNGTEGLSHVEAFVDLANISFTEGLATKSLHQKLSVDFKWTVVNTTSKELHINSSLSNEPNSTSKIPQIPYARSGNPGYIVGKPVLAGFWVKRNLNQNESEETSKESESHSTKKDIIQLSRVPLSLPGLGSDGMCNWSESTRQVVTFAEDLQISCGLRIFPSNISSYSSCLNLKSKMLQLLLGDISNALYNSSIQADWGRVVAAFGNANVSRHQDWVPLLLDNNQAPFLFLPGPISKMETNAPMQEDTAEVAENRPLKTCENVVLGINLHIMHGFVGPTSNPQSKILGAFLRFSSVQDIALNCPAAVCFEKNTGLYLRVVSSVKFVDISSPAVTRFAEPPAIHIRLPPDFFYPFMAADDSSSKSSRIIPSFVVLQFLMYCVVSLLLQNF